MNNFLKRLTIFIVGIIITTFAISLTIKANLGVGAWDALNVGLTKTFGFTVGTWVFIVGLVLIFLNGWLMKTRPDFLAIFTIILVGGFIDIWLLFILEHWQPEHLQWQLFILFFGILFLALGISIYLQAKFPIIPIDKLMIAIRKRTGVSLMIAKTIGEVMALVLAFIFKGPIGVGTVIITFSIGPLIQLFFPKVESTLKKWNYLN